MKYTVPQVSFFSV